MSTKVHVEKNKQKFTDDTVPRWSVIRRVVFVLQARENNKSSVSTQEDPDTLVWHHASNDAGVPKVKTLISGPFYRHRQSGQEERERGGGERERKKRDILTRNWISFNGAYKQ